MVSTKAMPNEPTPAILRPKLAVDEHVLAAEDEQQQQQVAGEHVAEESQRERERAGDEVGEQLERG